MVTTNPLDAVAELQAVVAHLAPTLRPQVLPKGVRYGIDVLVALGTTEAQKLAIRATIDSHKPKDMTDRMPYVIGAFDLDQKAFVLERVQWLTADEALIHAFPRFLELQLQDTEKASEIVGLFLRANGHEESSIMSAQQCFNAAFALQTLLRAFPRPPLSIGGQVIEAINDKTDVRQALAPLFPQSKKTSIKAASDKANGANPQQPKAGKKNKKRKAGK